MKRLTNSGGRKWRETSSCVLRQAKRGRSSTVTQGRRAGRALAEAATGSICTSVCTPFQTAAGELPVTRTRRGRTDRRIAS